jgi:hypothetical protein
MSLMNSRRYHRNLAEDGKVRSGVLRGLFVKPAWLFGKRMPKVSSVLRELRVRR